MGLKNQETSSPNEPATATKGKDSKSNTIDLFHRKNNNLNYYNLNVGQLWEASLGAEILALSGIAGIGLLQYFAPTAIQNFKEMVLRSTVYPFIRLNERRRRGSLIRLLASVAPSCFFTAPVRICIAGYQRSTQQQKKFECYDFYQPKTESSDNDLYLAFKLHADDVDQDDLSEEEKYYDAEDENDDVMEFLPGASSTMRRRCSMSRMEIEPLSENDNEDLKDLKQMIQELTGQMNVLMVNEETFKAKLANMHMEELVQDTCKMTDMESLKNSQILESEEQKWKQKENEILESKELDQKACSSSFLKRSLDQNQTNTKKKRRSSNLRTSLLKTLRIRHQALHSSETDSISSEEEYKDSFEIQ